MTNDKIIDFCKINNITNYSINPDGSIDVFGNVVLSYKNMKQLPIKFNKIFGNFYCDRNFLINLIGAPKSVTGDFFCYSNNLTSLLGCPKVIGGAFYCAYNDFTSFEGGPESVGGDLISGKLPILNLIGMPTFIGGAFVCNNNSQLSSFEGASGVIKGIIEIADSVIKSENLFKYCREYNIDIEKIYYYSIDMSTKYRKYILNNIINNE